jgi:hypothetical protein
MKVTTCAHNEDVATNMVFVNPVDARTPYVSIGKFVYRCCPDANVEEGHVAMNSLQRRSEHVFPGDDVNVVEFLIPPKDFELGALTVEGEWLSNPGNMPRLDLVQLASLFRTKFAGHVLTRNQTLCMRWAETWIYFRVKSYVRGLVTLHTEVGVEWNDTFV